MKTITRNWVVTGLIFCAAVLFTVFCGLGIANMSRQEPTDASVDPTEPAVSSSEAPVTSSSAPETSQEPETDVPESSTADPDQSAGKIRLLSEEEQNAIYEKYPDIPQEFKISGERDEQNRPASAVDFAEAFALKYKRVRVFSPQTRSDVSLIFILSQEFGYTDDVLDILKDRKIRATFFVDWAYLQSNPTIIERILLEKHELGTLGASNPDNGIGLYGVRDVMNDFYGFNQHIEDVYDRTVTKAFLNYDMFKDTTVVELTQMGYEVIFYSASYDDNRPSKDIDASAYLQSLELQAHKGAIYRLHTVNEATVRMLPEFLNYLSANGYAPGLID